MTTTTFLSRTIFSREKLEPVVGIEPTTDGLQNRCSTAELNWPAEIVNRFGVLFKPDRIWCRVASKRGHFLSAKSPWTDEGARPCLKALTNELALCSYSCIVVSVADVLQQAGTFGNERHFPSLERCSSRFRPVFAASVS